MKISVILVNCDDNEYLLNTLYAIARQQVQHSLEVCIVDNCSDIDPAPIVERFLPHANYLRLEQRGSIYSARMRCLALAAPDTDIIIFHNAKVVLLQPFAFSAIAESIKPKEIICTEVRELQLAACMYVNYAMVSKLLLAGWGSRAVGSYRTVSGAAMADNSGFYLSGMLLDSEVMDRVEELGYRVNFLSSIKSIYQRR